MTYYLFAFNIDFCDAFTESPRDVVALGISYRSKAKFIQPGDRLIAYCYWPKFARWLGILDVSDNYHMEDSPWLGRKAYPVRLKVHETVWLSWEKAVPIHETSVWDSLQFTKDISPGSNFLGSSLTQLPDEDGHLLNALLLSQQNGGVVYPVEDVLFRKRRERMEKQRALSNPESDVASSDSIQTSVLYASVSAESPAIAILDDTTQIALPTEEGNSVDVRESAIIQAKLAFCGEKMHFKIWLPRNDRAAILQHWKPTTGTLLEKLPLSYDANTLRTIENIDVLWIRGAAIARAFEIEHTTSVYSGLLRMADLLALQPNMHIKLHIVAPEVRQKKVFQEILRPVFSMREAGSLSELCSFIPYDAILELSRNPHLCYLSDSVLEQYEQFVT